MKLWCQRCDQGWVWTATAKDGRRVFVCDECEALWETAGDAQSGHRFTDMKLFLTARSLGNSWVDLVVDDEES